VLQEAIAVLLLVLKYPTYNLAPETGAWIIGDALLAGDGTQMRHIKVKSTADVKAAAFQKLISAALKR
jgi:hypothetical protein